MSFYRKRNPPSSDGGGSDHSHSNITTLDKLQEVGGELLFKDAQVLTQDSSISVSNIAETTLKNFVSEDERLQIEDSNTHTQTMVHQGDVHGIRVAQGKFEYFDGVDWTQVQESSAPIQLSDAIDSTSETVAASSLAVKKLNDKVDTKADINHAHDSIYYQKSEVDNSINDVINTITAGQYMVKTSADDTPSYVEDKIDKVTLSFEDHELKVIGVDGLTIGIADVNSWLSGTSDNIQNQINDVKSNILSLTSGMKYLGKVETYADLASVGAKENGNVVVVLADESRGNGRSLYVYFEALTTWDFIGEFTFSNKFIEMTDTPDNYTGQNGKVIQVDEANNKLVFSNVNWNDISDKPSSTVTQIDQAVSSTHIHSNLPLLETYTQKNIDLANAVSKTHNHSNLSLLETYTQTNFDLSSAVANKHTHTNRTLLDTYNQTNNDLTNAVASSHTHTNKAQLDKLSVSSDNQLLIDGKLLSKPNNTTFNTDTPIGEFPLGETFTPFTTAVSNAGYILARGILYDLAGYTAVGNSYLYRYYLRTNKTSPTVMTQEIIAVSNNDKSLGSEVFKIRRDTSFATGNAIGDWNLLVNTLAGKWSPEGVINGMRGWIYKDIETGKVYHKTSGIEGFSNTGWVDENRKGYLTRVSSENKSYKMYDLIEFKTKINGVDIASTNTTFALKANKPYRISFSGVFNFKDWMGITLFDVNNNVNATEFPHVRYFNAANFSSETSESGIFECIVIPNADKNFGIRIANHSSSNTGDTPISLRGTAGNLIVQEL